MAALPFRLAGPYGGVEGHLTMGPFSTGYLGCTTLHPSSPKGEAQYNDSEGDFGKVTLGVGIGYLGLVQWGPLDIYLIIMLYLPSLHIYIYPPYNTCCIHKLTHFY